MDSNYLQAWADSYRKDLVENIMPFWLKHGLDKVHGGVYTCVDRDGSLMDTTKSVWFQGRFGFIAAFAYNNVEKNPEWLAASKSCIDFIEKYCFDQDGRMYFEVKEDGTPLRKRRMSSLKVLPPLPCRNMRWRRATAAMRRRRSLSSSGYSVSSPLRVFWSRSTCPRWKRRDTPSR